MDNKNEKNDKSLGYVIGEIMGVILSGCVVCTLLAITIRIISWIL
jgi:hypothetical protein